jgi:hypothetical protein
MRLPYPMRCRAAALSQESTRLLGLLASPPCPVRDAVLQPPILPKVLAHIKRLMQVRPQPTVAAWGSSAPLQNESG